MMLNPDFLRALEALNESVVVSVFVWRDSPLSSFGREWIVAEIARNARSTAAVK